MKASQVVLFIAGVFALLGIGWLTFPADGIDVGRLHLRFASLEESMAEASEKKVDVDSVLTTIGNRFAMQRDTLDFYRQFFYENPDRIYLPDDDYTFFDGIFAQMENARRTGSTVRVAHYGDSQIEMDRISAQLRQGLQERFGGRGTGMFPARSNVPSASATRSASGSFVQYTMYGDSTTARAWHNRYGVMAQVVQLNGGGTVSIHAAKQKSAQPLTKSFSSVSVLYGRASSTFTVKAWSDTLRPQPMTRTAEDGTAMATWYFPREVEKATVSFTGSAEIYGISADGGYGIAVDNIPLRGCSGTIFSHINPDLMASSYNLDNTRLIILQFGGNYMPVIKSTKNIERYMESIEEQIRYFQAAAPGARILFIGPSDMGKSVGGRVTTWPLLPELVDSLRSTVLRNDAAFWDLFHMMGGENSMVRWVKHSPSYAGPDYIHFTTAGAQVVGETLTRSFLTYYDFYTLRKTVPQQAVERYMKRGRN